jgi:hypothetical protein
MGEDSHYNNIPYERGLSVPTPHATYTSDYTTTDSRSGLIWRTCENGQTGNVCQSGSRQNSNWYNAVNSCADLNAANGGAGYAGITTWRLPTMYELITILDYSSSPVLGAGSYPNTGADIFYWTSTSSRQNSYSKAVFTSTGLSNDQSKSSSNIYYSRCVSVP